MYNRQGYPDRFAEPLVLLSTYHIDQRYRAVARDRLVDAARSAQSADRPRLLVAVRRIGADLRTWYGKCIHGWRTKTRISTQAAAAFVADQRD